METAPLAELTAQKYVELKALEKEFDFLRKKLRSQLEFANDESLHTGTTEHASYKFYERFSVTFPSGTNMAGKTNFYKFLHSRNQEWYRQKVNLSWKDVNELMNVEISESLQKGKEWEPWPFCKAATTYMLDLRARPGVTETFFDPRVVALGLKP